MSRPSPEEIWKRLVDEAGEDEIERAASVGVEEAERELAAAGFDVAAERARLGAFLGSLENQGPGGDAKENGSPRADDSAPQSVARALDPREPVSAVDPVAPWQSIAHGDHGRQRPVILWLVAAAMAAAGGGALYMSLHEEHPLAGPAVASSTPAPVPSVTPDRAAATALRDQAATACSAKQWSECLAHLDEARALDPAGDNAPSVQSSRERATRGLQEEPTPVKPSPVP